MDSWDIRHAYCCSHRHSFSSYWEIGTFWCITRYYNWRQSHKKSPLQDNHIQEKVEWAKHSMWAFMYTVVTHWSFFHPKACFYNYLIHIVKLDGVEEAYYYSRLAYMQIHFYFVCVAAIKKWVGLFVVLTPNFTYDHILSWLHDESVETKAWYHTLCLNDTFRIYAYRLYNLWEWFTTTPPFLYLNLKM